MTSKLLNMYTKLSTTFPLFSTAMIQDTYLFLFDGNIILVSLKFFSITVNIQYHINF